jgi:3-oxoacyl-[acyl-carrier-protein] synthase III
LQHDAKNQPDPDTMKLAAISLKTPSLKISNTDILDYIARYSAGVDAALVRQQQKEVAYLLRKTGSRTRYYRDRDKGETALGLLEQAIVEALQTAGVDKQQVDLLIFCGVGRGFIEPANAYFVAHRLGMSCDCFDVADACMSWVRALELASFYLSKPDCHNVLVVNAEFTTYEHGFPGVFRLDDRHKIAHTFPAYTIGEAASATVLQKADARWQFDYLSVPAAAPLCTIPMAQYLDYSTPDDRIGLNGPYQFVSFGSQLFEQTLASMGELVARSSIDLQAADLLFPHGAAGEPLLKITDHFDIPRQKISLAAFPAYGNLISASIPAAMTLALESGSLKRGMNCVLCPASAGMSFALVSFTY